MTTRLGLGLNRSPCCRVGVQGGGLTGPRGQAERLARAAGHGGSALLRRVAPARARRCAPAAAHRPGGTEEVRLVRRQKQHRDLCFTGRGENNKILGMEEGKTVA